MQREKLEAVLALARTVKDEKPKSWVEAAKALAAFTIEVFEPYLAAMPVPIPYDPANAGTWQGMAKAPETPDFDAIARKHLLRYGSGAWIDREAPILALRFREAFEAGANSVTREA